MELVYNDGAIRLFIGDAANLTAIPGESIDLIVTSPPYNIGPKRHPERALWKGVTYLDHDDQMDEAEYQTWQVRVLEELYRVVKPGGSLFYNHKIRNRDGQGIHPLQWVLKSPWTFRQQIVWDRGSTHNHEMSYFWPHDELILWLSKGAPYLSEEGARMGTVWRFPFQTHTWHPAPFPPELPARCIRATSRPGDTVLDPFGGSMTTCLQAKCLGRRAIGVDISREYVERASQYCRQEVLL